MFRMLSIVTLVLAAFFSVAIFTSSADGTNANNLLTNVEASNQLPQKIKSIDLDKAFDFAGEALPMDNFDVRERLDRELLRNAYWHSNTLLNIKKASRYFPMIEEQLHNHGIPTDFKYLAVAESDLSNATSPAGAKGFGNL